MTKTITDSGLGNDKDLVLTAELILEVCQLTSKLRG